jgi:ABC-type transport system substrate-binding protein
MANGTPKGEPPTENPRYAEAVPLVVGLAQSLPPLNPTAAFEVGGRLMMRQVFDAPFFPAAEGEERPTDLLFDTFVPTSVDGCHFRATVRDRRFSNGAPLEPTELAQAIELFFGSRGSCRPTGRRLDFTLARPNPRLDLALSLGPLINRIHGGAFIGTAKFKVVRASPTEVILDPNPFHPTPPSSGITFRAYPRAANGTAEALLRALTEREVDLAPALTWRDLASLDRVTKLTRPVNSTGSLYFNTERLSLDWRRALAAAIDPAPVALAAFGGDGVLQASSLLPTDLATSPMLQFHSPSTARKALEGLVPTLDRPLTLRTIFTGRSYLPDPAAAAEVLRAKLAAFDVRVAVQPQGSAADYLRALLEGDYDLLLTGNVSDSADPADFFNALLHSEQVPTAQTQSTAFNFSRLRSTAMDDALADFTAHRSRGALEAVVRGLREQVPLVPLTHGRAVAAHQWHVKGVRPSLSGLLDLAQVRNSTLLPFS